MNALVSGMIIIIIILDDDDIAYDDDDDHDDYYDFKDGHRYQYYHFWSFR